MKVSVISTVFNEEYSIHQMYEKLTSALKGLEYELIFVNDGSSDSSLSKLKSIADDRIKVFSIEHAGKSAAMFKGFQEAKGEVIGTIDADLQDDPEDLVKLINSVNDGVDFVCGWRSKRMHNLEKKASSRIANSIFNLAFGMNLHDSNCPLKAFKRECVSKVKYFKRMHRFLTVLAHKQEYRIIEVEVRNYPRVHGKSKYGLMRLIKTWGTLLKVKFNYKSLIKDGARE